jgi:P2-related tail formation protein
LFNNEAVLGDKIHGAVKINVNSTLLEGKVVLVLESTVKINKPVQKTKLKMSHFIKNYQNHIQNKMQQDALSSTAAN